MQLKKLNIACKLKLDKNFVVHLENDIKSFVLSNNDYISILWLLK